jgi:hypothetical protein
MIRSLPLPRLLILALLWCGAHMVMAQGRFTVNGRLKIDGSDLAGARAVVYKNGEKDRTITTNLSKFALDLDLNANYVISFEKDGYVAKKLSFNTKVPADAVTKGFTPFEFAVSLFKQYDDLNIVVFNQPVGVIRYEPALGDFDYDTDYTKSIQSQLQKTLAEVERRQKEEAQQAAAAAKAKAKADAEAERQAEAQAAAAAKAEAEARKQAEATAKAEQARQEPEPKRSEAERSRPRSPEPPPEPQPAPPPPKAAPEPVRAKAPEPVRPVRNGSLAKATEGQDTRRTQAPVVVEEGSPVAMATPVAQEEAPPNVVPVEEEVLRNEELLVETNKVTTIIRLEKRGVVTEYRKITHKWGTTYYFRDGLACSQLVYEREALGTRPEEDRLAGATPRGKLP